MDDLLLHKNTRLAIEKYLSTPAHALLISGPGGSGKNSIARHIAAELLDTPLEKLENSGMVYTVSRPEGKQSISIEAIRELQTFLKLKSLGGSQIKRVIIIDEVGDMQIPAQNAFLKLLEEPPEDTIILMTTKNESDLLTTILSRVQRIQVFGIDEESALAYFSKQTTFSQPVIRRAWLISQGSAGLISTILSDDIEHPVIQSITNAKQLLGMSAFNRLTRVDVLSRDKLELMGLLDGLARVSHGALLQSKSDNTASRWLQIRKATLQTQYALHHNAQSKLATLSLLTQLP